MDFPLGEWLPDLSEVGAPGLLQATNVEALLNGYRTMRDVEPAGLDGLPATVRGADRGQAQSGTKYIVAGTETNLYLNTGGTAFPEKTRGSGDYSLTASERWDFAFYGDDIVAVPGPTRDKPQVSIAGAEFADALGSPSKAAVIETVAEFIVLGNIVGTESNTGIGTQEAGVHWSAIGYPTTAAGWPTVGTDAAIDVQSDYQLLQGDGGPITDIVAASEYTVIFRERGIWRMDYVGAPNIFAFRKIDDHRGCLIPGSAIAVGNVVYFPSEQGFMSFDGARISQIGAEKVDRTWRASIDLKSFPAASVAHDPETHSIHWGVPTTGTGVTEVYVFNYVLNQWAKYEKAMEWLLTVLETGVSLDDAPYATDPMDPPSSLAAWTSSGSYDLWDVVITSADRVYQWRSPPDHAADTAYSLGDYVTTTAGGGLPAGNPDFGRVYECTTAGTSAEPADPPTGVATYSDGGVVWTFVEYPYAAPGASSEPTGVDPSDPVHDGTWVRWTYMYTDATSDLATTDLDSLVGSVDEKIAIFSSMHELQTFTSDTRLTGTIETRDFETPGETRTLLRSVRPIYDGPGVLTGMFSGRFLSAGDTVYPATTYTDVNDIGLIPTRIAGRYLRGKFEISGEVNHFDGFNVTTVEQGRR